MTRTPVARYPVMRPRPQAGLSTRCLVLAVVLAAAFWGAAFAAIGEIWELLQ